MEVRLCGTGVASKLCPIATRSLPPAGCCARGGNISASSLISSAPVLGSADPGCEAQELSGDATGCALSKHTDAGGEDGEWLCKVNIWLQARQPDRSADSKHCKKTR